MKFYELNKGDCFIIPNSDVKTVFFKTEPLITNYGVLGNCINVCYGDVGYVSENTYVQKLKFEIKEDDTLE